jgi:hypothetical protein
MVLKRLVVECKPDIILIQETMCLGDKVVDSFRTWLQDWTFCAIYFLVFLGLLSSWSPNFKFTSSMTSQSGLVVDVEDYATMSTFRIINIYGLTLINISSGMV